MSSYICFMKKIYVLLILVLYSCTRNTKPIEGLWFYDDKYYQSEISIENIERRLKAKVMNSFDGTSRYLFSDQNPRYVFNNLILGSDGCYVDAVSSETRIVSGEQRSKIQVISEDTLLVNKVYNGKIKTEIWTRIN